MLRIILFFQACIFSFVISAQTDSAFIVNQIKEKGGYSVLLKRFIDSDSTLKPSDFKLLYYGFRYEPTYKPLESEFHENLLKAYNRAMRYKDAVAIADSVLIQNPVSLRAYFEKAYSSAQMMKHDEEAYNRKRYIVLCNVIKNSGSGTPESPFITISVNDALEFLAYLGLPALDDRKLANGLIEFDLAKNKLKKMHLYFSIPSEAYIPPTPIESE